MVHDLTTDQVRMAARTSYAYWVLEAQQQQANTSTTTTTTAKSLAEMDSIRLRMAMMEAKRHLVAMNGNVAKAFERFQETCQYRLVREKRLTNRTLLLARVVVVWLVIVTSIL